MDLQSVPGLAENLEQLTAECHVYNMSFRFESGYINFQ